MEGRSIAFDCISAESSNLDNSTNYNFYQKLQTACGTVVLSFVAYCVFSAVAIVAKQPIRPGVLFGPLTAPERAQNQMGKICDLDTCWPVSIFLPLTLLWAAMAAQLSCVQNVQRTFSEMLHHLCCYAEYKLCAAASVRVYKIVSNLSVRIIFIRRTNIWEATCLKVFRTDMSFQGLQCTCCRQIHQMHGLCWHHNVQLDVLSQTCCAHKRAECVPGPEGWRLILHQH